MKINASVGRAPKNVDLHAHCQHLKLDAQTEQEAAFLAWLYRTILKMHEATISEFREIVAPEAV